MNRFEIQGHEKESTFGLNRVNFGFRTINPTIGRFDRVDLLSDKNNDVSAFSYANNNPVFFIDPFGLDTVRANDSKPIFKNDIIKFDNGTTAKASIDEVIVSATKNTNQSTGDIGSWTGQYNDYVMAASTTAWSWQDTYFGKQDLKQVGNKVSNFVGINNGQKAYEALRKTRTVLKSVSDKAGKLGFALASISYFYQLSDDPSKVTLGTHVNYAVGAVIFGAGILAAGTFAAPIVGTVGLIYGTIQLGVQVSTGKNIEQIIFDKEEKK